MVSINSTMVWEIINFLVLLWLLKKFLYGPITQILQERSQKIEGDIEQAEKKKEEAEKSKQEYEAELREARDKAQEIIEEAEVRGKKKAKKIIGEAEEEAEQIRENKMKEIEQAKKDARDELRTEVSSISLLVAGKFIQDKLDQEKHEKLIKQYISNLDREKLGEVK